MALDIATEKMVTYTGQAKGTLVDVDTDVRSAVRIIITRLFRSSPSDDE